MWRTYREWGVVSLCLGDARPCGCLSEAPYNIKEYRIKQPLVGGIQCAKVIKSGLDVFVSHVLLYSPRNCKVTHSW